MTPHASLQVLLVLGVSWEPGPSLEEVRGNQQGHLRGLPLAWTGEGWWKGQGREEHLGKEGQSLGGHWVPQQAEKWVATVL